MEIKRHCIAFGIALGCGVSLCAESPQPPKTPTPKPGTLAAAAGRELKRSHGSDRDAPIIITDDNLSQLADGAVVTLMTSTIAETAAVAVADETDPKTREKWRKRVHTQSRTIARLEARRSSIKGEIDRLSRGRLDSRTLDLIDKAEEKLAAADSQLQRERTELSRIIRAARREGAQPGWFR